MWYLAVLLAVLPLCLAQTDPRVRQVPAKHVPPDSGAAMFRAYCASCHGLDGRGRGPAAPALKTPVPDLTVLTRQSNGKFPERRVYAVLTGQRVPAAHGSRDMPVWGAVFSEMGGPNEGEARLRLRNLTRHIELLQSKAGE